MILRERPSALMLFFVVKGSILPRILPQLAGVAALSALVVAAHRYAPNLAPGVNPAPFTLLGVALSVFLSFKNNSSYDRWWEARKLWGQIIQTSRDVSRQTIVLDPGDSQVSPERRAILESLIAFAKTAVRQQRKETAAADAGAPMRMINPSDAILVDLSRMLGSLSREGRLTQSESLALNESLVRLSQALTGCERLANTPIPFTYALLLHRTAYLFCFMLPFGLADSLGWATPLATAFVAYTFFGLDALGEELSEPFSLHPNGLPIAAYATIIEINLRAAMGETDLPAAPAPTNYILM